VRGVSDGHAFSTGELASRVVADVMADKNGHGMAQWPVVAESCSALYERSLRAPKLDRFDEPAATLA